MYKWHWAFVLLFCWGFCYCCSYSSWCFCILCNCTHIGCKTKMFLVCVLCKGWEEMLWFQNNEVLFLCCSLKVACITLLLLSGGVCNQITSDKIKRTTLKSISLPCPSLSNFFFFFANHEDFFVDDTLVGLYHFGHIYVQNDIAWFDIIYFSSKYLELYYSTNKACLCRSAVKQTARLDRKINKG